MKHLALITALSALAAGCASNGSPEPERNNIYYFGGAYYHVPPGYHAHCHQRRLQVIAPDGNKLTGKTGFEAMNAVEGAAAIDSKTELSGQPVLTLQGTRCHNGYARYRQPPQIIAEVRTGGPGRKGPGGRIDVDTVIDPGGVSGTGRGSLQLP